jgi:hypothetical protein
MCGSSQQRRVFFARLQVHRASLARPVAVAKLSHGTARWMMLSRIEKLQGFRVVCSVAYEQNHQAWPKTWRHSAAAR